jgi:hypothetical protein
MAKMLSPNTTIWWVPASTVGWNPDTPSAALLTADMNISEAVVAGYTLNPTDSDTDDSKAITSGANVETPTFGNYEGNITYFREGDPADTTSAYARAFELFKHADAEGYFVRRVGYRSTVAAAATHEVDVFYFSSDTPQDVVPDDGGPIQFTVKYLPQGKMVLAEPLAA